MKTRTTVEYLLQLLTAILVIATGIFLGIVVAVEVLT